jgi:nucleotide-binding universal stress UspA family protein
LHAKQEFTVSNAHKAAFSAKKILLPIDFSLSSEAALEAATGLAEQFHAGIHLVHIIPEIPDFNGSDFFPETAVLQERRETIEEKLDARKEQLMLKGVAASFSIETGNDIVGSLMRVIKREKTDMVVISTHGMSGWHPLVFGSIAEQVIKQVNCTLLLLQSGSIDRLLKSPQSKFGKTPLSHTLWRQVPSVRPFLNRRACRRDDSIRSQTTWLNEVERPNNITTKLTHFSQSSFGGSRKSEKVTPN